MRGRLRERRRSARAVVRWGPSGSGAGPILGRGRVGVRHLVCRDRRLLLPAEPHRSPGANEGSLRGSFSRAGGLRGGRRLERSQGGVDSYWIWTVATGAYVLAVALLLHFALLFSNSNPQRRLLRGVYGVTLGFEIINLWRGLVIPGAVGSRSDLLHGWVLVGAAVRLSVWGGLAWVVGSGALLVVVGLLVRSAWTGRREAIGPLDRVNPRHRRLGA